MAWDPPAHAGMLNAIAVPMPNEPNPVYKSPPYSGPLREVSPPRGGKVRVEFACPHCGAKLERDAGLEETRWYLPSCALGHSGIGVHDPNVERVKGY